MNILACDARFLVVDKPAGLPAHAGRAGGPSVEDYFGQWRHGKTGPWLAHRLDRDTAGCLLIARKKAFLVEAQMLFAQGLVEKTYWAVVRGVPARGDGRIDLALAKQVSGRSWKMMPDKTAPPALTYWRLKGQGGGCSWLEFSPKTGRTHQLRAHAAALGHPIIGDAVYGAGAGPLQLLARALVVPVVPKIAACAPVPPHMAAAMGACGYVAA